MFSSPASSSSSSSSSSARSSPVHAASLVDPATHSPALMQLIDIKLSRPVVEYLVDSVVETVDFAMGRSSSPGARGRSATRASPYLAPFTTFVSTVLSRAEVTPATALVALVYIARARPHLSIALEEWALERVFLGALIVASKYTNDSTLKNVHWALCTGVFGKRDVGRIEREFLDVLDWELAVREADLLAHHQGLLAAAARRAHAHKKAPSLTVPPARTHARRDSGNSQHAVPELEPSSPASSLVSLSPRTPAHPAYAASPATHAADLDVPMDVEETHAHGHSAPPCKAGGLRDLLRAFPRPRHHHAQQRIHVGAA